MKKKLTTLSLLAAGFAFAFANIAGTPVGAAATDEEIEWPEFGYYDPATGFVQSSNSYGFKRLDDRRTAITSNSAWGSRCYFGYSFSIESFEVEVDLSYFSTGGVAGVGFGNRGVYVSESGIGLWADFLKSSSAEGYYIVTLGRGSDSTSRGEDALAHNYSLPEWTADNLATSGSYQGRGVYTDDDTLTFGWVVNGDEVEVYVNDQSVTFEKDYLFKYMTGDEFYFMYAGGVSQTTRKTEYTVINHLGDAEALAYYDEDTGAYYEAKKAVDAFVAATAETTEFDDIDEFVTLYTQKDTVGVCFNNLLYDFDEVYLRETFDPALETLLANGLAQFGDSLYVSLLDYYVTYLEDVTDGGLETEEELFALMAQIDTVMEILEALENATLTEAEENEARALIERYAAINQDINALADALYTDLVQNVIDLMTNAKTVDEVYQAEVAYLTLSTTFDSYVSESVLDNMTASLASAREAFLAKYSGDAVAEINGWRNGSTSQNRVIEEDDGIGLVAWTGISAGTQDGGGLLYTREALDVIDFSMTYEVTQLTTKYAISFMADPTFFSSATDASVAEHTGLTFLITSLSEETASVQPYLIDSECMTFYDGDLGGGSITIPKTGEITLEFKIVQIEEDGAINNYFQFSFNGITSGSYPIKAMDLLNAFPNGTGYVGIGSQGNDDQTTPVALKIKEVNGKSVVDAESLKADASIYTPLFGQDAYTYQAESGNNLTIGVDPRLQTDASFALDGETLTATDDYLYTNNSTLTLRASFLYDVEVGEHTLTMTTAMGTGSTTLIVEAADTGEDEDDDPITGDEEPDTGTDEEDPDDEEPVTTDEPGSSSEEPTTTEDTTTTDTEGEVEPDTGTEDTADEGGLGTGAIIGIAIGAIVVLAVIAGLVVVLVRKKKA